MKLLRKECSVSKEAVEMAYEKYRPWEKGRFEKRVRINTRDKDGLWKLWVLALFYQATNEKASETLFGTLQEDTLTFNPARISTLAKECGCPLLTDEKRVQSCDFKKTQRRCSHPSFLGECPVPRTCDETRRFARIAKQIVTSALYLRSYDFSFEKFYASQLNLPMEQRTQVILDKLMTVAGEKIAHLFLGWLSDPLLIYGDWNLNHKRFLAINGNIKRVVERTGLCKSKNTSVIRAALNELQEKIGLENPKVLELALLYVGQNYCLKNEEKLKCNRCPLRKN